MMLEPDEGEGEPPTVVVEPVEEIPEQITGGGGGDPPEPPDFPNDDDGPSWRVAFVAGVLLGMSTIFVAEIVAGVFKRIEEGA